MSVFKRMGAAATALNKAKGQGLKEQVISVVTALDQFDAEHDIRRLTLTDRNLIRREVWREAYQQGVDDEVQSQTESDGEIPPGRNNPYEDQFAALMENRKRGHLA